MALTPVPPIDPALPPAPDPADDEVVFDAAAYAFTSAMPGFGDNISAIGAASYSNALHAQNMASAAEASASTAEAAATTADARAIDAAASATDADGYAAQAGGYASAADTSAGQASGYADAAGASALESANSAAAADASEAGAAAQALLASEWAAKMDGTVAGGEYSAKYWAGQAASVVSDGVIQDETTSSITTWSSTKMLSEFGTLATQSEMEAGTEAARRAMSPLLVAQAIGMLGKQKIVRSERTSNTALVAADFGKLIDITAGTFTQTFAAAATLGAGWWCYIKNSGSGDITLDPSGSETVDGLLSFVMYPNEVRLVQCDGAALRSIVMNGFYKTFTASGTFVKPPGYALFKGLLWAGGGSGAASIVTTSYCGGGGGGACVPIEIGAGALAASETVTIGAGGAAVAQANSGQQGGNSSFGSITSYCGAGGAYATGSATANGGGGGGAFGAGAAGVGGLPSKTGGIRDFGGGTGSTVGADQASVYGGGGGGYQPSGTAYSGGQSMYGGGGGGNGASGAGGVSVYGGNGGAGGNPAGFSGQAPGGGGGAGRGSTSATSGAGARGELRIWGVI